MIPPFVCRPSARSDCRFPHQSRLKKRPSHSCEGRNLRRRKAAGNCKRLRRQLPPTAMRFLPSQEWN
ncbi:MAG: hypothetical protein ACR2QC_05715 [Gammaproteobacteria bacterium]